MHTAHYPVCDTYAQNSEEPTSSATSMADLSIFCVISDGSLPCMIATETCSGKHELLGHVLLSLSYQGGQEHVAQLIILPFQVGCFVNIILGNSDLLSQLHLSQSSFHLCLSIGQHDVAGVVVHAGIIGINYAGTNEVASHIRRNEQGTSLT